VLAITKRRFLKGSVYKSVCRRGRLCIFLTFIHVLDGFTSSIKEETMKRKTKRKRYTEPTAATSASNSKKRSKNIWVSSALAVVDIPGNNPLDWLRGGVRINPGPWLDAAFAMINRYGVPQPLNTGVLISLDQWAAFVAVSSFLDANAPSVGFGQRPSGAGVAVDRWRPVPFGDAWDVNNAPIPNVFRGFDVDLAVYGQAVLHRLSYNFTLLGKIAFGNRSPDPAQLTI
jgi:hypothetical protein